MVEVENKNSVNIENIKQKSINKNSEIINCENKKEKEKRRYYIFDNIKGILILAVVFGHFLWNYSSNHKKSLSRKIVIFIYSFHMQVFVFISGFLTTNNAIKLSNAIKLLILYFIFIFPFSLTLYVYFSKSNKSNNSNNILNDILIPKFSHWYLLSLFWWRISIKYIYNIKCILIINIIISLFVGYFRFISNILSLIRTFVFFPFFIAGYKISKSKKFDAFLKWKKGIFKFIIFFLCFSFFLYMVNIFIEKNQSKLTDKTLIMFSYSIKKNNTIKERISLLIIASFMTLFFLSLFGNDKKYL